MGLLRKHRAPDVVIDLREPAPAPPQPPPGAGTAPHLVQHDRRDEHGKRDVLKGKAFADFVTFVESECAKRGVFVVEQWEAAA